MERPVLAVRSRNPSTLRRAQHTGVCEKCSWTSKVAKTGTMNGPYTPNFGLEAMIFNTLEVQLVPFYPGNRYAALEPQSFIYGVFDRP